LHQTGRGREVCKAYSYWMQVKDLSILRSTGTALLFLMPFLFLQSFLPGGLKAGEHVPALNGVSLNMGYTYDPSDDICFAQVSLLRLYDYDSIWPHNAPENLRFKVEGSLGGARLANSGLKITTSVNIFALLYLNVAGNSWARPYVEAGIGGIYTDYKVVGQDYKFNFNPQAGVGLEIDMEEGLPCFTALRIHHLSNCEIGTSNRGQNSVVWLFGRYF